MIVSASRRTDIPAFYSDWFLRRLERGEVLVPNPWNPKQLSRVRLSPDGIDCFVFWTKNPGPMLDRLGALDASGYRYYFSFTLTPYGDELEKRLPPKTGIVDTFKRLVERLGPKRVDWRYDPILVDERHSVQWHFDRFGELSRQLRGFTERCIVNFVKPYRHLASKVREMDDETVRKTAEGLSRIASGQGLPLFHCAGKWDLHDFGIEHAACIDAGKIQEILSRPIRSKKDSGQPKTCRCVQSVDIGIYGTCPHGCVYCYANRGAT